MVSPVVPAVLLVSEKASSIEVKHRESHQPHARQDEIFGGLGASSGEAGPEIAEMEQRAAEEEDELDCHSRGSSVPSAESRALTPRLATLNTGLWPPSHLRE